MFPNMQEFFMRKPAEEAHAAAAHGVVMLLLGQVEILVGRRWKRKWSSDADMYYNKQVPLGEASVKRLA